MTAVYELASAAVLLGWLLSRLLGLALPVWRATLTGFGLAILIVSLSFSSFTTGMFIGLLAPFGVLVPALALQNSARAIGMDTRRYSVTEMLGLWVFYLMFLTASAGVFDWDPYRFGYAAPGAATVALAMAAYAVWRGHVVVLASVVLAQALWLADIGSSNFYDQISHVLLVFILPISALRSATQKPKPNPDGENR